MFHPKENLRLLSHLPILTFKPPLKAINVFVLLLQLNVCTEFDTRRLFTHTLMKV